MKRGIFCSLLVLCAVLCTVLSSCQSTPDTIKVLALGSKTSEDAVEQYLWDIANADSRHMITGNAYIPACTLEKHYGFVNSGDAGYGYRKVGLDGVRTVMDNKTLKEILQDEEWDYVSIQQLITLSDDYATMEPYLDVIIGFLRANLPEKTKIVFHQTWSFGPKQVNADFEAKYGNDNQKMYEAICVAAQKVLDRDDVQGVIPAGTAVQNARQTALGDDLTRDNVHMDENEGRYTVALTWYETLFGVSCLGNTYHPAAVSEANAKLCQESAHAAVKVPFKVSIK